MFWGFGGPMMLQILPLLTPDPPVSSPTEPCCQSTWPPEQRAAHSHAEHPSSLQQSSPT